MRARSLSLASLGIAMAMVTITATPVGATGLSSGFGNGKQGWTCQNCGGGSLVYNATGGNPTGHVTFVDGDSGINETVSSFLGPNAWAGDRSADYNGTLSYDLRVNAPDGSRTVELALNDSADSTIDWVEAGTAQAPTSSWGTFSLTLTEAAGWRRAAALAACTTQQCILSVPTLTRSEFKSLLAHFGGVAILADYESGVGEQTDLDNVSIEPPTIASRTLTISYSQTQHAFKGRITSAQAGCASNQSVSVYRLLTGPDQRFGTVTTGATGRWTLPHSAPAGTYYALAPRSNLSPGMDCATAKSAPLKQS
jgi:hypothetical protein